MNPKSEYTHNRPRDRDIQTLIDHARRQIACACIGANPSSFILEANNTEQLIKRSVHDHAVMESANCGGFGESWFKRIVVFSWKKVRRK